MAQKVECMPSKLQVLSSTPTQDREKKKKSKEVSKTAIFLGASDSHL
jgi:hypothetical protein